eukprot:11223074-Lingulodinium_polyedra.AAC.1
MIECGLPCTGGTNLRAWVRSSSKPWHCLRQQLVAQALAWSASSGKPEVRRARSTLDALARFDAGLSLMAAADRAATGRT